MVQIQRFLQLLIWLIVIGTSLLPESTAHNVLIMRHSQQAILIVVKMLVY